MEMNPIATLTRLALGDFHACIHHPSEYRMVDA